MRGQEVRSRVLFKSHAIKFSIAFQVLLRKKMIELRLNGLVGFHDELEMKCQTHERRDDERP